MIRRGQGSVPLRGSVGSPVSYDHLQE